MSVNECNRRGFLGHLGGLTAAITLSGNGVALPREAQRSGRAIEATRRHGRRAAAADAIRREAAAAQRRLPDPVNALNGDEERYPNRLGSFGKGLPHNGRGEVDPAAFAALVKAMSTGAARDFDAIPVHGPMKLRNPQAALSFDLQGADSHALSLTTPPAFASAETAAEMIELYWQALTRDVPFSDYATDPRIAAAAVELSAVADFTGPRSGGRVTPQTIFRSFSAGDVAGPYVSQFLLRPIPFGAMTVAQRIRTCVPALDYLTGVTEWLACQNGGAAAGNTFDPEPRHLRSARDLIEYVHRDYSYQPYMNAALILLGLRAPYDANHPYRGSMTQTDDLTFGAPAILDLVARITMTASKHAWHHKWAIHRRLRPEEYGGCVHHHTTGAAQYPIHRQVLDSEAVARVRHGHGSSLLPIAYPEGCPTHPAYPAGHACLAGACVTMLKAFFDESWTLPDPVVAATDGRSLVPWAGEPLTVGHELNKLAGNIAIARNASGVHWRSDGTEGLKLGEAVALNYLAETRALCNEPFNGFSVTKFDGTTVIV